jgi:hypothetical protein
MAGIHSEDLPVAKPNYSFEKRQRELAKKRKKEEKSQKKASPSPGEPDDGQPAAEDAPPTSPPAEGQA